MAERAETEKPASLGRRLVWFIGLWALGVATVAMVAFGWRTLVGWLS
jgi:hypothetical protein